MRPPLIFLAIFVCSAGVARAESPECRSDARRLGDADLPFPTLQPESFIATYAGIHFGAATIDIPNLPVGILGTQNGSIAGQRQSLELGIRLTDWIGISGRAQVTTLSGITVASLVANGADAALAGDANVLLRLWRNDRTGTLLSAQLGGGYEHDWLITILPLVTSLIDTPGQTLGSVLRGNLGALLLVPEHEWSLNAGIHAAQVIDSWFSVQASIIGEHAWLVTSPFEPSANARVDQQADAWRLRLAVAAAANFATWHVPVSLMAEYLFLADSLAGSAEQRFDLGSNTAALTLGYSGRSNLDLAIGLSRVFDMAPRVGTALSGAPALSGTPTLTYAQLLLRYVW